MSAIATDGGTVPMNPKRETLVFAGICILVILLSAGGLVYGVKARLILAPDGPFSLDGILLTLICLTMGGIFTLMLVWLAVREGWVRRPGKKTDPGESPEKKT